MSATLRGPFIIWDLRRDIRMLGTNERKARDRAEEIVEIYSGQTFNDQLVAAAFLEDLIEEALIAERKEVWEEGAKILESYLSGDELGLVDLFRARAAGGNDA
jgi:hypothetical protein